MTTHTEAKKRVLVVDDDPALRVMLAEFLRRKDFQVLLAEDGVKAQRVMNLHSPALILLDLMMPKMNGWDFLAWLRDENLLPGTKVIAISAFENSAEDIQRLIGAGASLFLRKPFDLPDLFTLIRRVM
jgi:DNA-binding response OmpR family regulator